MPSRTVKAQVIATTENEKHSTESPSPVQPHYHDNEDDLGGQTPSQEEKATLRRIGEPVPKAAFLVAVVELCERFTYYGASGIFQNYISKPRNGSQGRGALGMGPQGATGLSTFFQFWCYVTPIVGAIVADQYLGKYNTILFFACVYIVGLVIMTLTALPVSLEHHSVGLGGFVTALVVIGLGTGGIKSNVAPLIADQYKRRQMIISTDPKNGERVIIDPAITIQRIYMIFFWCINVGSLSGLATPYLEKYKDFWSAYLLCLCMFVLGTTVLVLGKKFYTVRPPQGSVITNAFRVCGQMIRHANADAAKPSRQSAVGGQVETRWDDHFVDEVKRALVAMRVFCFYPIFWVCYNNFSNNFVTQASQMASHGIPNDLMQNFDPISIIVILPIVDQVVFPWLRKMKINFYPINRITAGFWFAALAMMYACIIQYYIYRAAPCYDHPLCKASEVDGVRQGNQVHIATQIGAYMLIGISEIFASVTGLEYAYTKAPVSMKSFVQSMYLLTTAFGAAIGEALVPVLTDPKYVWMYAGLAISSFVAGCLVWILFHHLNAQEESLNALDQDHGSQSSPRGADAHEAHKERV